MKQFIALAVIFSLFITPLAARADINAELQEMFNSWGFSSTSTSGGAYEGQTRGYYTGGSVVAKSPIKNINLVSFSPPSITAGCGGIDFHTGAFSFINLDQFTNTLRAIGQNATGYAFSLALEVISPTIAGQLQKLQNFMNQINQMSSNSCYAAKTLVNSAYSLFREGTLSGCVSSSVATGSVLDRIDARLACTNNPRTGQDAATAQNKEGDKYLGNVVWDATGKFSWGYDSRILAMSLLGTWVHNLDVAGQPVEPLYWAPTLDFEQLVGKQLDAGGLATGSLLTCADAQCLQVVKQDGVEFKPFVTMTREMLLNIASKIQTKQPLEASEIQFVQSVPLPVLKMLNVATTYPGLSEQIVENGAEFIAVLTARDFLNGIIKETKRGIRNLPKDFHARPEDLDAITRDIYDIANDRAESALNTLEKVYTMVSYVQAYEQMLNDRLPEMLRRNVMFGRT